MRYIVVYIAELFIFLWLCVCYIVAVIWSFKINPWSDLYGNDYKTLFSRAFKFLDE